MTKLNEQQLEAVLCEHPRILCLAGAGVGKTFTMLQRISRLVDSGVNPSSILALTFTNAAAFEMRDRYKKSHPNKIIPEFRTFHSFCYHLITVNPNIRRALGYLTVPTIADDALRKKIIKEAGSITSIKSSLESLEKKSKRTTKEQYDYEMLKKTADKLMTKKNTITFDNLCYKICELFTHNSPLADPYKDKYKYIFVDEFQDTDDKQNDFVQSFKNSSIFVCGDALQSLYRFRGADSSIIKKLSENPEWNTIKLYTNYRSTKNICKFANINSTYANKSYRIALDPGRADEGVPVNEIENTNYVGFGSIDTDTLKYIVNDIRNHKGSTAIICRTNSEVSRIQSELEIHGIQYRSGKREIDVENVLKSVGNNEHLLDWLASYLNSDKYAEYIRVASLTENYTIVDFIRNFGNVIAIAERWNLVKCIRRICKESSRSIVDRCNDILEVLECEYLNLDESRCTTMKSSIDYIYDLFSNTEEDDVSDIYVGTIHSVKGLEFDNVYVVGVNGPNFKLDNEDNKNLYYVAITRAKNYLTVFVKNDYYFEDEGKEGGDD